MAGQLIRDVRATLDIDVAKAQKGLRDLEKSGQSAEKALKDQEDAAKGYERQLEKTGTAASTMRRRLEAATRALPKITITADSSDADSKLANLRESLQGLSSQKIGIDVSGTDALAEMRRVKGELEELARTEADPIVRADVQIALRELRRVEDELDKLERDSAEVKVDVDTSGAVADVDELAKKAGTLSTLFQQGLETIGSTAPGQVAIATVAIAALPLAAQVAAAGIVAALGGALAGVGLATAAQADRVKFAWSEAVSSIKSELGDVAAPLEDSAIHASKVAQDAFAALKPILRDVFADLGPDVDRFVDGLGEAVKRIGPSLEPLGDAFGELLRALGDRAGDMGDDIAATITTLADTTREHADDIANVFAMITTAIRATADGASWLADRWDEFLTANELLHSSLLGVNRDYDGSQAGLARLNEAAAEAIKAAQGLGTAANETGTAVRSLNEALAEHFDPAQKALDAEIRLKQALEEAGKAAKEKKLGELDRLRAVQDLTKAIADAAKAESERTGKTTESAKAFAEQLPQLVAWAGKNDAARDAVAGLGNSLGITIKKADDGTIAIGKMGKAVITLPNGKEIKIDAKTAQALSALQATQNKIDSLKDKTITVTVRTEQQEHGARASMRRAAGGIDRYAAGGILRAAEGLQLRPQPPQIVSKPTVLFGEGSSGRGATEAFIPYEQQFRPRAIELLGQVAEDFGLGVYNREAARTIADVGTSVQTSAGQVAVAMGGAVDGMDAALGQSGSLTNAIVQVGGVGTDMTAGWIEGSMALGESVTGMSDTMTSSIDALAGSVDLLAVAVSAAGEVASSASTASRESQPTRGAKKGTGHSLTMSTVRRKDAPGMIAGSGPKKKRSSGYNEDSMIAGHYGTGGNSYAMDVTSSASSMLQASTLRSVPAGRSSSGLSSSGGGSGSGSLVSIGSFTAAPDQSPYEIAQNLDWIRRGG